jgi:ABC-2 type transport system ATP-binding protein
MISKGKKVLDGTLSSIQDTYGTDTIRMRTVDGLPALREMRGIESIRNFGNVQELHMSPGCDPREVLQTVLARTTIQSFEITRPSLHDIFIRVEGLETREVHNA